MLGRLEIYWPEGAIQSYPIEGDVLAIGRQSGNDLVIDREGISRYHAKLRVENETALLEDLESVNGTYVDGVRLAPEQPLTLRGGEEIQFADVRMIYYPPEATGDTLPVEVQETEQVVHTDDLMVHLTGPEMVVVPGAHGQAAILIENLTDDEEVYAINMTGIPPDWVRLDRPKVHLAGGVQAYITVSIRPTRRSETKPGRYTITVTVTPESKPEAAIKVEMPLDIGAYSGYGVVMGTPSVGGQDPFQLYIHNQGNAPLTLAMRGHDATEALNYQLNGNGFVTLEAGERKTIGGQITTRTNRLFGDPRQYRFEIISQSQDASQFQAPVSGSYLSKPLLPGWAATVALPLVAILAIALVALLLVLLGSGDEDEPANPPVINSFSLETDEVALGEPVILKWDIADADSVDIVYNRPEQTPQTTSVEDTDATTYQLNLETSGLYSIQLIVENPGGQQLDVRTVSVLPSIVDLTTEPNTLLQNVSQTISVEWDVTGALMAEDNTGISLESVDLPTLQRADLPPTGMETFTIFPTGESANMTLRILGLDGTESSLQLSLAVEPPRCTLQLEEAIVYMGPDVLYETFGVLDEVGTVINPSVRNGDSTWLQFRFENRPAWVRAADFECEGFDPEQLDPAVDVPPLPTTPAPTAEADDDATGPAASEDSSTPEPTEEPSTPEPTEEPSTPEATEEPSTPEATEESSPDATDTN